MKMIHTNKTINGNILVTALVFASVAMATTVGLINWGTSLIKSARLAAQKEQAFQIAEAGIDYYCWHLANYPGDYTDGTNIPGPYVHEFKNKMGEVIGSYTLDITPPPTGSTRVEIVSTGTLLENPNVYRKIQAILAIPSLATYAVVANDNMRFGSGTVVHGPIHSNQGIRFDGEAYNVISSAKSTYTDPDTGDAEFGVYTMVSPSDPTPPANVPDRSDVFRAGRQFPVPAIDFAGLLSNLQQLQSIARSDDSDYGPSEYNGTAALGYHVVLNANDTYSLYVVTSLIAPPSGCTNSSNQSQWGTWSIRVKQLVGTYPFPEHGVLFFEDHVWVDGAIDGARLTIAAGKFPAQSGQEPNITINNDLLYTRYDGSDAVGLIAQGNVNVGLVSDDNLRIDAALVAENGRAGRFYYNSYCRVNNVSYYRRSTLTLYGMIATNRRYGFAYTNGTGYEVRNISYDGNLLYSPPPNFPLASSRYKTISWKEI